MTVQEIQKIIAEKVTGKIIPRHDEFGHHYEIVSSGRIVDSVTTKIIVEDPDATHHLKKWQIRMALESMERKWQLVTPENREEMFFAATLAGQDARDDAGRVGTSGHRYIDDYLQHWIKIGRQPEDIRIFIKEGSDPRVYAAARSAEKLFKEHNVIPVASELLIGDDQLGVAGTMDLLALFDGKLLVSDWKTSNRIRFDMALQVSMYRELFKRMTGIETFGCNIVQLNKSYDGFRIFNIPRPNEAVSAYKGQMKAYDWLKNGRNKLCESRKIINL